MEQKLLISGPDEKWIGRVLFVAGVALLGGFAFANAPLWISVVLLSGGVLLLVLSSLRKLQVVRRRRWITMLPDGFRIVDRRGERTFTDDDLICMSVALNP